MATAPPWASSAGRGPVTMLASDGGVKTSYEKDTIAHQKQEMHSIALGNPCSSASDDKPASRGMVAFSVLFYLVAALVMIIANKWVLNSVQVPLFFLFVQLAMAVALLHIAAIFGYFVIPRVHISTCRGLLPLIAINVTGLIFNTYCLQYVDASFYQVARGLVLPFTVCLSFFTLASRPSSVALAGVLLVCVGFFLGVNAENLHSSTAGTILGVFSSLTTSVHAITVKKALAVVQGSTMDLVYYNNLLSALLLAPLILLSGESEAVLVMLAQGGRPLSTFLWGACVTGIFGFLICIAGFLSIKVTSPVTHMISSAVRGVVQTFLGMWCFGDIVTAGRGLGILFILMGSSVYAWAKEQEQRSRESRQSRELPTTFQQQQNGHAAVWSHRPQDHYLPVQTTTSQVQCDENLDPPRTPRNLLHAFEPVSDHPIGLSPSDVHTPRANGVVDSRRSSFQASSDFSNFQRNGHVKSVSATEFREVLMTPYAKGKMQ